jgi:hypothetical protein
MTDDLATTAQHETVTAVLKFLASKEGEALYVASIGGGDETKHEGSYRSQEVIIENGRLRPEGFSLDKEGFQLLSAPTRVRDFYDDAQIDGLYEAEVMDLLKRETGASRVEIFDYTRRSASLDVQKERLIREPAAIIHNDYTATSGVKRLRDFYADDPAQAEELLARRFAIINVWRSIAGTVETAPIALCDAGSLVESDLVSVTRQAKERTGQILLALHNPAQRWYYFPKMTAEEALLIKTFDSADDGRARFAIHSAFQDPTSPPDAPARESIETRCFVFF